MNKTKEIACKATTDIVVSLIQNSDLGPVEENAEYVADLFEAIYKRIAAVVSDNTQ